MTDKSIVPSVMSSIMLAEASQENQHLQKDAGSLEEAGALLGAVITRLSPTSTTSYTAKASSSSSPPSTHGNCPSNQDNQQAVLFELYIRLHDLENWLCSLSSSPATSTAAPSILAVLIKLFQVCVACTHPNCAPLLSHGIRHAWANSVAICCKLASTQRNHTAPEVKNGNTSSSTKLVIPFMMEFLASVNPKSQKAHGGTRLAAMCVLQYMYASSGPCNDDEYYERQGNRWAMDVLQQVSIRGLKTHYGSRDDLHYRIASMKCAINILIAHRTLRLSILQKNQHQQKKYTEFSVLGALDDRGKTMPELIVKLIRHSSEDTYPEVRYQAAVLASVASSVLVSDHSSSSPSSSTSTHDNPLAFLEEVMILCFKNLDDVQSAVSLQWSNALARCMCVTIDCAQIFNIHSTMSASSSSSSVHHLKQQQDDSSLGDVCAIKSIDSINATPIKLVSKWKAFRSFDSAATAAGANGSISSICKTLQACIELLVSMFRKAGGEFIACPLGGSHSVGGRATRIGYSSTLIYLLRLVLASPQAIQWNVTLVPDVVHAILLMVGDDLHQTGITTKTASKQEHFQHHASSILSTDIAYNNNSALVSSTVSIFSGSFTASYSSSADAPLARLATNRVLRRGLGGISSEPTQRAILHYLTEICNLAPTIELLQQEETESTTATANIHSDVSSTTIVPNEQQLQVALVEMSHIITALGEAACESTPSSLLLSAIRKCRVHADPGVRCETSILSAALVNIAPHNILCELLHEGIDQCKTHLEQLVELLKKVNDSTADAAAIAVASVTSPSPRTVGRSFRRKAPSNIGNNTTMLRKDTVNFLAHQYALHGNALMLSTILHQLSHLSQSVPIHFLDEILAVAESLITCQFNEALAKHNAGAACTCVRAGYSLFAAAVTIGPSIVRRFLQNLIANWEKTGRSILLSTKHFFPAHDLICLEAMLSSLLSFLKFCSCLLISVPDALNRINLLLEKLLPLVNLPDGRLGAKPSNTAAAIRLNSVKASIMEILTWLPPGSYPIAARQLFSLASHHIKESVQNESCCSLLQDLLPNEDRVLDLRSLNRAFCCSQVDEPDELLAESFVALSAEPANPSEIEAVMHSLPWKPSSIALDHGTYILGCPILGFSESEDARFPSPSVLHEVTNWRRPTSPNAASRIRLVDAAIQAFAHTFGLQSPREQEMAIKLLKSLLPASLVEPVSANSFSVKDVLMSENDRRVKSKHEHVIGSNIVATLILCIKSLPRHMGNEPETISGASWSKLAGEVFRILMGSCSVLVRRSASVGLALLATCGYNENALGLQTEVLTSLEEAIQWTSPADGKLKKATSEAAIFSSSAALLTVGCLQRSSHNGNNPRHHSLPLPSSHMIRRLLISLSTFGGSLDTMVVRVSALHSLSLVIAHYHGVVDDDWLRVLQTSCQVAGQTFVSIWTSTNIEGELVLEPSLLAALLRLMHSLLPHTVNMVCGSQWHARFSSMAASILEVSDKHPAIVREALAFFDSMLAGEKEAAKQSPMNTPRKAYYASICIAILEPTTSKSLERINRRDDLRSDSLSCRLGALTLLCRIIQSRNANDENIDDTYSNFSLLRCRMFTILEMMHGTNFFRYSTKYRGISPPRIAERWDVPFSLVIEKVEALIKHLFNLDVSRNCCSALLNWLLFSRILASGAAKNYLGAIDREPESLTVSSIIEMANSTAAVDVQKVASYSSPSRWQVKRECCYIAQLALVSLYETVGCTTSQSVHFNPVIARHHIASECRNLKNSLKGSHLVHSYASLHLEELISTACSLSTATSDQAELPSLQLEGLRWLSIILVLFYEAMDPKSHHVSEGLVLSQYTSQIVSCVRHALSEPCSLGSMKLYLCGCEVALLLLDISLIKDVSVLRRLLRQVIPADIKASLLSYSSVVKDGGIFLASELDNCIDSPIFRRITCIGSFAQIQVYIDMGIYDGETLSPIVSEVAGDELAVAVHAAALSIDAFQLSRSRKLARNLSGHQFAECSMVSGTSQHDFVKGFHYSNIDEISDVTFAAFNRFWPSMASFAVSRLAAYIKEDKILEANDTIGICKVWLSNILPVLFIGARQALRDRPDSHEKINIPSNLSAQRIVALCVFGIRKSLHFLSVSKDHMNIAEDLDFLLSDLTDLVQLPSISVSQGLFPSPELIAQTSGLITDLCRESWTVAPLTKALLLPLSFVQVQKLNLDDRCFEILSTCLLCLHSILTGTVTTSLKPLSDGVTFTMSLIDIGLRLLPLSAKGSSKAIKLHESTRGVLSVCLRNPAVTTECKRAICLQMSSCGNWGAWSFVCSHLEGISGLLCSVTAVKEALNNEVNAQEQKEVLKALNVLLEEFQGTYTVLNTVMNMHGSDILFLLKRYGLSLGNRNVDEELRYDLCHEAADLLLLSFNQLVRQQAKQECEDDSTNIPGKDSASRFLVKIFDVLVAIIQHAELPISKTRDENACAAIGKLCARTIVELAKTSATTFKVSLSCMAAEARHTIEHSMRAELTSYHATSFEKTKVKSVQKKGKIDFRAYA